MTVAPITREGFDAALAATTDPEQIRRMTALAAAEGLLGPKEWLELFLPSYFTAPFGAHQERFWRWVWSIRRGQRSAPHLNVWARGGAKSTSVEAACVALGQRQERVYVLYVCRVQTKADDHVANIGSMLGSQRLALIAPELSRRAVTEYGTSRGWKRTRLHTASGFVIDALGLDAAARGAKVDEDRPDLIVLDDIDDALDGPGIVASNIVRLSRSIIPAGSADAIVMGAQNMVNPDGVFAQIADGRAEMLGDAVVNGPVPALDGAFAIEPNPDYDRTVEERDVGSFEDRRARPWVILGGEPTWAGQDRDACERMLANMGPTAFRIECQHEKRRAIGGMYDDVLDTIEHVTRDELPDLVTKTIWLDPAMTDTDNSDAHGCQCDGISTDGTIYRLRSWEERASPGEALLTAIRWSYEEGVDHVGVEMNVGADMSGRGVEASWRKAFDGATTQFLNEIRSESGPDHPWLTRTRPMLLKTIATSGTGSKADRSATMHADYERPGRIVHVVDDVEPYHERLEAALARAFKVKPFDLADAAYWSWRHLRRETKGSITQPRGNLGLASAGASYAERRQAGLVPIRRTTRKGTSENPFGRR